MPTSKFIHTTKNKPDYNTIIFFIGGRTWYFVLNVIICLFSGGVMVMWANTHCFDFFSCNLIYIASICAKLQTSSASPSILIDLFKVATYLSCGKDY